MRNTETDYVDTLNVNIPVNLKRILYFLINKNKKHETHNSVVENAVIAPS